ncbi:MAG: tetratricopeptide repeat protein [Nibricoccus sp.]
MPAPQPSHARTSFWETCTAFTLGSAALLVALFAAYANSLRVPFLFDDADAIASNPTITHLSTAWLPPSGSGITTSGRPLLNVSLAVNYALHGTDVVGYHVGNLLIHALAALMLWAVLRRTLRQPVLAPRFSHHATPLAWCAAMLWAIHPLQTESVTYIIQRAESLVGLFYLLTLYGFIRSVEKSSDGKPVSRFWPVATVLTCLAGMASKEVMASAPLIIFLYDRTFVSGSFAEAWRRHRMLHLALAATWLLLLACILQSGGRGNTVGYRQIAWWEYALTQAPAIIGYLWRSLWPADLIFDYGISVEKNPAVVIPACAAIVVIFALAIYTLRRHPVAGFAFAWFILILAPTSSIIPVATQTAAEHRMYLPLAAVVVSSALLLYRWNSRAAFPILAILLAAAGLRTHARNHDYRSEIALWENTVGKNPSNVRALTNLGALLSREGHISESIARFEEALALAPGYARARHNLGSSLFTLKRYPEAIAAFERALAAEPDNPEYLTSLGNALVETGEIEKSLLLYRIAYALHPDVAANARNLANSLMRLGRMEEAGALFQSALTLAPEDAETVNDYSTWLRRTRRPHEAIPFLEKALLSQPDSARLHSNLGTTLIMTGRTADGIRELETALRLDPDLVQTRYQLGSAYASDGRPDKGIPHLEALLKLTTPDADLLDNLGALYAQTGRYADAIATFQQALQLDPAHGNARQNLEATQAFLRKHTPR